PGAGRVEHDPHEIWEATQDVVEAALGRAGITADGLAAIGITNQRDTTVVWDRRTGEPYCNAIVRQDDRTDQIATVLERDGHGDLIRQRTGLPPAPGPSAAKIQWILENVDDVRADADAGHAIFGTTDSWLIWWLTGGPDGGLHVTDVTNAGRTLLMDLETLAWDDELLALFDIPRSMLPEIRSSSEVYGRTEAEGPFKGEVDIAGDLVDRQAALVGQVCFEPGELRSTHGTSSSLMLNTGTEIVRSTNGLLTTPAYRFGDAPPVYALEGSTGVTGSAHEEICHDGKDVVDVMIADAELELRVVRVDGGVSGDDRCMQMQADVLGVPVSRPVVAETAALGAAYAAGLAVGFWASTDELVASWNESRRWEPTSTQEPVG
ncbi:MAG: FGGY family carbohydrate kinase, partial [Aeromicrobium sp.]